MSERDRRTFENEHAHNIPIVIGSSLRFRMGHCDGRNRGFVEGKAKIINITEQLAIGIGGKLTLVGIIRVELSNQGKLPVNVTIIDVKTRLDGNRWSALLPNKGCIPVNQSTAELEEDYEITFYRKKKNRKR